MDSYAAPWWSTLFKLRFPAAVPYMVPALKLGAAGAVIGVMVSEISTGCEAESGVWSSSSVRPPPATRPTVHRRVRRRGLGLMMSGLVAVRRRRADAQPSAGGAWRERRRRRRCLEKIFNQGKINQVDALVDIDLVVQPGEFVSLDRPVGMWQEHAAAPDRQPHRAHVRLGHRQRQVRQAGPPRPGLRHGVPAGRPVRVAHASPRTSSCRSS